MANFFPVCSRDQPFLAMEETKDFNMPIPLRKLCISIVRLDRPELLYKLIL